MIIPREYGSLGNVTLISPLHPDIYASTPGSHVDVDAILERPRRSVRLGAAVFMDKEHYNVCISHQIGSSIFYVNINVDILLYICVYIYIYNFFFFFFPSIGHKPLNQNN